MNEQKTRLRNAGFVTFFFSGICAISSGVVVSLLQEQYGFAYGMTGTLLSLMSIGNLLAGFLTGVLPGVLGLKPSILLLTIGYTVGYGIMGFTGAEVLLAAAFFLVGVAKGSAMNACTILVSDNSADRTRGMNLMHSCYACGALLCPFLIAAAARVSTALAVFLLAALGVVLWLVYWKTPMEGKVKDRKAAIDWSFLRSGRFWLLTGLLFCQTYVDDLTRERGRAERDRLDGDLLQGQRHHCGHTGCLYRDRDVGGYTGGPAAHCIRVPIQVPAQGDGGHGCDLHPVLRAPDAGRQPAGRDPAAVRLRVCDGRHEPHRSGQRGQDDQRDQHGHHAARCVQRCHPDALGHRPCGRARGPCRRDGDEHRAVCGAYHLLRSGGKTVGTGI